MKGDVTLTFELPIDSGEPVLVEADKRGEMAADRTGRASRGKQDGVAGPTTELDTRGRVSQESNGIVNRGRTGRIN